MSGRLILKIRKSAWLLFILVSSMPWLLAVPPIPPESEVVNPLLPSVHPSLEGDGNGVTLGIEDLPRVSITAINDSAYAQSRSTAVVEISSTRGGNDLPVTIFWEGNALNGIHYELMPGTVTIPKHKPSVQLKIRPIPNDLGEGNKAVIIKLVPHPRYHLGEMTQATVWIYDVAYHVWRVRQFGRLEIRPDKVDRQADPDGDGYSNFIEYLFDLDPQRPDYIRSGDFKIQRDGSYLRTSFWCRYSGVNEFKAEIEYSTNLIDGEWLKPQDPSERYFATVTPVGVGSHRKREHFNSLEIKKEMESTLFLRVKFNYSP